MKHRWDKSKTCIRCGLTKREKQVNLMGGMAYSTDGFITFRFDAGDCIEVGHSEKYCPKCNKAKDKTYFAKDTTKKDGLTACCKSCRYVKSREWMKSHPEMERIYGKRKNAKEEYRQKRRKRNNEKAKELFPKYKFFFNLRRKSSHIIRYQTGKRGEVLKYIGCTRSFWMNSLESQFKPGMSWSNYGETWEIDHKVPIASVDKSDIDRLIPLFHWSNTQPLFKDENRKKKNLV